MLASWLERRRRERAAKRYATLLPAQLVRDFGASETYNPAQIRRGAERAKLPPEHLAFGFAAFLDAEAFAVAAGAARAGEYEALRAQFTRHRASSPASASGNVQDSLGDGMPEPDPD